VFCVVQLSDLHVGATWASADPLEGLKHAIASVHTLGVSPDAILISGDLADHGTDAEYAQAASVLSGLSVPVHVLAGNHDRRDALRRHFDVGGEPGAAIQYSVFCGPVRFVIVDSTHPGEDRGELDAERLAWLDHSLAAYPNTMTLVAMHHPPLATDVPAWDEFAIPATDRRALEELLGRHPQVVRVLAGHLHRALTGEIAGRPLLIAPSTYVQERLRFGSGQLQLTDEPPGYLVHSFQDGTVTSYTQPGV
jgi:3',5'-cyclic-AMP phosphodiesterase